MLAEEPEELLPIVILRGRLEAIIEAMHGDVLRVIPREDLGNEKAVREVPLRVSDAVRQV